ncbi:hypothetical protein BTS2_3138 [Bacillus sp. TS-2]|nr:hypothetical protein BTS2_3138 [Bacillus sp. TS-2]
MKLRLLLFLTTATLLLIAVGCSSENTDTSSNDGNSNSSDNQAQDHDNDLDEDDRDQGVVTEKELFESLLEEANKYTDRLLKDENYVIGINRFGKYDLRSYTWDSGDNEVEISMLESTTEREFEKDEEDYELSNGLEGTLGDIGHGFKYFVHYDPVMRTTIDLGDMDIEDAREKLDSLEFRDEDLTEEELEESLGFTYEDVKFFDNGESNYNVSELWLRGGNLNAFEVRYRNPDAGEYDAIDIGVSAEEFEIPDYKEQENVTTNNGKEVIIVDDGFYAEWFWQEDDGYFYRIGGNYSEEEVEKKEYNLEVIDKMINKYGQ